MNEIEWCNLIYKIGMVKNESEQVILFMTIRNDITSYHLPFMNGVSMRCSKTISFHQSLPITLICSQMAILLVSGS